MIVTATSSARYGRAITTANSTHRPVCGVNAGATTITASTTSAISAPTRGRLPVMRRRPKRQPSPTISADEILYNKSRDTLEARGNVRYLHSSGKSGGEEFVGEALLFNVEKQEGVFLKGAMKQGQRAAEPVNRDGFRRLLEDGLRQLQNDARAKSVTIAPDLAFGVQRYMAGNPPADDELARLVDQFQSIFALCEILYDAGIGELVGVERTVFEKDAQVAAPEEEFGRRGARNRTEAETVAPSVELAADPLGLFTKEHYVLTYKAQDAANWKVLDRLAHGAPFAVVTSLDVANPARPAVAPPPAPPSAAAPAASRPVSTAGWQSAAPQGAPADGAGAAPAAEILPRELRVVAGQELPTVRLEVDVYRFAETAVAVAQGEENP